MTESVQYQGRTTVGWPTRQLGNLVGMLMEDASAMNEVMRQGLGAGRNRRVIDLNMGDPSGSPWTAQFFGYERCQVDLTAPSFKVFSLDDKIPRIDAHRQTTFAEYCDGLLEIAAQQVNCGVTAQ